VEELSLACEVNKRSEYPDYRIREGSWLAALAAAFLNNKHMAIVFGETIHLFNVKRRDFLANEKWLKHELCHIAQFKKYGRLPFTCMYLWESLRRGYVNNRFEKEARDFADSNP
jgi:hypothetical protein